METQSRKNHELVNGSAKSATGKDHVWAGHVDASAEDQTWAVDKQSTSKTLKVSCGTRKVKKEAGMKQSGHRRAGSAADLLYHAQAVQRT